MADIVDVTISLDEEIKEDAEAFFAEVGLNLTTAINIFLRQTLRQGKIPFEIAGAADPFYSDSNMLALRASLQQLREGQVVHKTMDELLAMEAEAMEREAVEKELVAAQ